MVMADPSDLGHGKKNTLLRKGKHSICYEVRHNVESFFYQCWLYQGLGLFSRPPLQTLLAFEPMLVSIWSRTNTLET